MNFKESKELLDQLLQLDTSLPHQQNHQAALDLIDTYLPATYSRIKQLVNGVSSSFWYPGKHQDTDVLISGHIDVLPADVAQFQPRRNGDRLYARGAYDMKGPLVATLDAFKQFTTQEQPALRVGILITADEEVGGFNGTGAFLMKHPELKPKVVIIPDGGSGHGVVIEQKGYIDIELTFIGKSAHSARPWEGDNAVVRAMAAAQQVAKKFPDMSTEDWNTTVVVTGLHTHGSATNAVPDRASLRLNIRNVGNDSTSDIITFCKSLDEQAECRVLINEPALVVDAKDPALEVFSEAYSHLHHKQPLLERYPSTSDARYFSGRRNAIIIARPLGGGAHSQEEWVSMKSLADFSKLINDYLVRLAKIYVKN